MLEHSGGYDVGRSAAFPLSAPRARAVFAPGRRRGARVFVRTGGAAQTLDAPLGALRLEPAHTRTVLLPRAADPARCRVRRTRARVTILAPEADSAHDALAGDQLQPRGAALRGVLRRHTMPLGGGGCKQGRPSGTTCSGRSVVAVRAEGAHCAHSRRFVVPLKTLARYRVLVLTARKSGIHIELASIPRIILDATSNSSELLCQPPVTGPVVQHRGGCA